MTLDERDRKLCRLLQGELPDSLTPYRDMAEAAGMTEKEALERIRQLQKAGIIRRLSAFVRHQKVGFAYNMLVVWKVPAERIEEVGQVCAAFRQISHCYQRITYPHWQHNLYTMIHGRDREDVDRIVSKIKETTGLTDYMFLRSVKEYKKASAVYF